ncbi:hypothetical protein [Domibacillus enclensis]|uniref:Uncharacterized protein n=1 Tax=Domibacillus enclensis TaxID=1017273 RepID=A0A1N7AV76_9BACI|nr:hypothetical protein [Domibacillus enclensis]OXS75096.1 hypothetical protein B1B05_15290 [Domibacillus enclensis]SIR42974.1 hypothetical protein SAMN05443094_10847 [Domibacillus enclensis]
MRTKWHFTKTEWADDTLRLLSEEEVEVTHLQPVNQVITDSDAAAFVYLAEAEPGYVYLYIHENTWVDVKKALDENHPIVAVGTDGTFMLQSFHEEMNDLIVNIEGNSNYGEEMVEKVERVFFAEQR